MHFKKLQTSNHVYHVSPTTDIQTKEQHVMNPLSKFQLN